jgi:hypothetical protein
MMLKLIGFVAVVYIGWVTGIIQAVLMLTAALLVSVASL